MISHLSGFIFIETDGTGFHFMSVGAVVPSELFRGHFLQYPLGRVDQTRLESEI